MENPNPIPNPNLPNSSPNPNPNPNPQKVLEALIETLLSTPDLVSPSDVSLALEQGLLCHTDVEKVEILKRSLAIGSYLQDAASRLWRQHDSFCNSLIWPLTQDLTIKVFSLLDVHSLCQVAASCSLFNKAAMEPACYREIDLMDRNLRVDNSTVAKIVQRSGQHLRSLKLGLHAPQNKVDKSPGKMLILGDPRMSIKGKMYLSKSCLEPLVASNGAAGALLQTLHLHNIAELDSRRLCKVIAVCPGLLDLEVVGLHVNVRKVLHSVTSCCHSLMRLCVQSPKTELPNSWLSYSIRTLSCNEIVHGCPKISSLLLRGFKLPDQKVKLLLKGLHHLLEVDFSGADLLTGSFLRDLVVSEDQKLESLKLRDCLCLRAAEVKRLLSSLSTGECKSLRHLDVSNKDGLVSSDWGYQRSNLSEEILSHVRKDRPELDLHADFPDEKSSSECDSMSLTSSFGYSEYSEPLQPSFHSEDILSENTHSFRSTSSIDTDQDSDDEDADEFEVDSDSNDHDENEDEDEDTQFLSPCDYSEGEDTVFHMDNDSPSNQSDAGETGLFFL